MVHHQNHENLKSRNVEIDKLTEYVKGIGAKGLAYVRWVDEPNASFKFIGKSLAALVVIITVKFFEMRFVRSK